MVRLCCTLKTLVQFRYNWGDGDEEESGYDRNLEMRGTSVSIYGRVERSSLCIGEKGVAVVLPTLMKLKLHAASESGAEDDLQQQEQERNIKAERKPPRKGRQAAGRFLKLLTNVEDDQVQQALQSLRTSPHSVSSAQAALLITKIEDPLMVFDFYRFLRVQPGFDPHDGLYAALIDTQVKSVNLKPYKVRFYLQEMEKRKLKFTEQVYCGFINSFLPLHFELAQLCYNLMKLSGTPMLESYNSVIAGCSSHGLYDMALSIVEEMRARNLVLNSETYHNLLWIYRSIGNAREALRTFIEMEDKRILPTEESYNLLLSTVGCGGQLKVASSVLREMSFLGFKPDEASSGNLIEAFLNKNMVDEADSVFREGTLKDPDVFSLLIKSFAQKQNPWRAIGLLRQMWESGMNVSDFIYSMVIHTCGRARLVEEALKIFNHVKDSDRLIDESIYLSMLYVLTNAEMQNSAEKLYQEMVVKGVSGNAEAYLYMMSMYGKLGRLGDVLRIFGSMKRSGCTINVHAYSCLIDIMGKAGQLNRARSLLSEMRMSQIQPDNVIYSTLISAFMSVGLINHALSYIDEFQKSGLKPDGVTAGTIAIVFAKAGRYSDLETLVDDLVRRDIKLPREKVVFLIDLCADKVVSDKIGHFI